MLKTFCKTETVRAVVERTVEADSLEEAEEMFNTGTFDGEERIIDILDTIEDHGIEELS